MTTRERIPPTAEADAPSGGPDDLIGQVIDERYRVEALIGSGGMGNVYRAEHVKIHRPVALKVLHQQMGKVFEFSKRFEREAVAIGRIDHPNCVRVSDFGKLESGSLYLVLEYVEGVSLYELLETEGRLDLERALRIGAQVLRGLRHVHEAGIVHRDIKPENILLESREGEPEQAKILDFGIAKLIGEAAQPTDPNLTQGTASFGTPVYMSPEQVAGDPVDARTDLYSLSIVLYQALTGRPPFEGEDLLTVMRMHTGAEVPPMEAIAPAVSIPPEVEALVRRGLEKRRDDRFESAAAYLEALDGLLADEPVGPEIPAKDDVGDPGAEEAALSRGGGDGAETRVVKPQRSRSARRLGVIAAAALAVLAVLAGGVALTLKLRERGPSAVALHAARLLERGEPQKAIAYLEKRRPELEGDVHGLAQLGHAYSAVRRQADAIAAYRGALEQGDAARDDEKLRTNLFLMTDELDVEVVIPALELLIDSIGDEEGRERLIELASSSDHLAMRASARELAEELALAERVDRIESYSRDLVQSGSCEARRAVVAKLRALGNPRAIPALEKALARKGAGGAPVNGCLREDAKEAIEFLERSAPEPEPAQKE